MRFHTMHDKIGDMMKMSLNNKMYQLNLHIFDGLNLNAKRHLAILMIHEITCDSHQRILFFWDEIVSIQLNFDMHNVVSFHFNEIYHLCKVMGINEKNHEFIIITCMKQNIFV